MRLTSRGAPRPTPRSHAGGGTNTPEQPHPDASILGSQAFENPATLAEFVNFVRQKGGQLGARAVVSVVPKSKVAFPQVRRHVALGAPGQAGGGLTFLSRAPGAAQRSSRGAQDSMRRAGRQRSKVASTAFAA
jgi:hypothetical protein